jgi:endoglucanase
MQKILSLTLVLVIFGFSCGAQSVAQKRCDSFKQGVNLSDWLESYWDTNWPVVSGAYNRAFLVEMKAAGINSVRLPVCFALVTDTLPPYNVDTANPVFGIVDTVLKWAAELDMRVIIDNHHQWNITDANWRQQQPRLGHLWSVLAQRYALLDPDRYFFEVLNEPSNTNNDSVRLLYMPVIDSIRQYAPHHSIIASANDWSNGFGLFTYRPLPDTNMIYTFHSYDPYNFTHQGLSFVNPPLPTGIPYPHSVYDALVSINWDPAMHWRDSFQLPLFLGEFGVGNMADDASRCNWIDTMGARIDYYRLSAFHWDMRYSFPIYYSGVVTRDSIIPCFRRAMHLYGDTLSAIGPVSAVVPVNVFPNPAQNSFAVDAGTDKQVQLTVSDNTGRQVWHDTFYWRYLVNTSAWSRGLYLLKLQTDDAIYTTKVVVE